MAPNTHSHQPRSSRRFSRLAMLALLLAAFALVASACGRDESTDPPTTPPTTAPPGGGDDTTTTTEAADPCEGTELESSEIGISADTITVLVMADVGSPLAPGLFQGSIDGTKAWVEHVNNNGGLACRQLELIEHDSMINPVATTNGFLEACEKAVAMIGSTSLFATDVEDLNTCADQAGNPTGIPDIAERAVEAVHGCSPNTFAPTNGVCPYSGGAREYHNNLGAHMWLQEQAKAAGEPLHGIFLIPGDLPSAINSSMPGIRGHSEFGVGNDGEFKVSGASTQAEYGQFIEIMNTANSNYAYTGSDDQSMIKWKSEAKVQGVDLDSITWICSIACYTPNFLDSDVAAGTYLWLPFLPFEERAHNEELDTFLTAIDKNNPPSWAAGAWVAGRMFESAVNNIVAAEGLNAITRKGILAELNKLTSFDANGWFGELNWSNKLVTKCYVLLQVQEVDGENTFVRVAPDGPGTFNCDDDNIVVNYIDSAAEADAGPDGYEARQAEYEAQR